MDRLFLSLAALFGAAGVGIGAFGAHALAERLSDDMQAVFETATRYHFYHALALLAVAWATSQWPDRGAFAVAGWLFAGGIVVFSGSLYLLALTDTRWLGAITPVGGVLFIAGWLCLAWAAAVAR